MTSTLDAHPPASAPQAAPRPRRWEGRPGFAVWAAAVAVTVGVLLRLWPRSALWLDEAQSVAFGRLPLVDISGALREDGAPPLYYFLLHVWMAVFGDGDYAVRSLSIICSLAMLVVLAVVAQRLAGPRAALATVVLAGTNPFAIRYATEARMYALVTLEVAIGVMLVHSLASRRDLRSALPPMAGVAIVAAALLYTHYWAIYLLAATAMVFAVPALHPRRSAMRTFARRTLVAVATGGVMWLPWVPTFLFQADHTSTPWTRAARISDAASILRLQAGGKHPAAVVLACILGAGLLVAAGRAVAAARGTAGGRWWRSPLWLIGGVLVICPLLAAVGGSISNSAFVGRYSSVVFPLLIVLAAIGLVSAGPRLLQASLLAATAMLGLGLGFGESRASRTPATAFATVLQANVRPGDVLVFCPDQLGPALSRAIDGTPVAELRQGVYPDWATPRRVNWIDYAARYERGSPGAFAAEADALAGSNAVWLIWSDDYPATRQACARLAAAMGTLRPEHAEIVSDEHSDSDHGALWRFDR